MSKNRKNGKDRFVKRDSIDDVKYNKSSFKSSEKEHKKINSYFLVIFIVGIILAFLFYEISVILNQGPDKQRDRLFSRFFSKEIGLVLDDRLNVSAIIEARINDGSLLKEKLKTNQDFCILILDSEDKLIYDEQGEPLYVCTISQK